MPIVNIHHSFDSESPREDYSKEMYFSGTRMEALEKAESYCKQHSDEHRTVEIRGDRSYQPDIDAGKRR